MDTDRREIPINTNPQMDRPLLDEASEENILDEDLGEEVEASSELSEDLGKSTRPPVEGETALQMDFQP